MPVKRGILLMYLHNKIFEKKDWKDNLLTSYALHYASNGICGKEPSEKNAHSVRLLTSGKKKPFTINCEP